MYVYTYIHIRTRCTWLKPRTVWEHPEILSRKSIVSVNPNKSDTLSLNPQAAGLLFKFPM